MCLAMFVWAAKTVRMVRSARGDVTACVHVHKRFECIGKGSLVPIPRPLWGKGSGDIWALSWFVQAQHSCFRASQSDCSSTIFMWYRILLQSNKYKVSYLGLAVTNQNTTLSLCIPLRSNMQPTPDRLHNIAVKSRACITKKPFQCHQTFPRVHGD